MFVATSLEIACVDNKKKIRCRDGVTCVVLCVACTLPSIYLVCVVFGTAAIPYIPLHFWKMFFILVLLYNAMAYDILSRYIRELVDSPCT